MSSLNRQSTAGLLLLALLGLPAHGEVVLDTILITAEREAVYEVGDVDGQTSSSHVSVIHKEQFAGRNESLAEVIEKEAGIQIRSSGGVGSFAAVSLRGSTSNQVMVFVDGVLFNDLSSGGIDLGQIALSDIEAIEIYKGSTPINFSRASTGGAINIRTHRAGKKSSAHIAQGYGSFATKRSTAFISTPLKKWNLLFSGESLSSDNDFVYLNKNSTNAWPTMDRLEPRYNNQLQQHSLLSKVAYRFSDDVRLDLSSQWLDKTQGLPRWNNDMSSSTSFATWKNSTRIKLSAENLASTGIDLGLQLHSNYKQEHYDDRQSHVGLGKQWMSYTTTSKGAESFLEYAGDWFKAALLVGKVEESNTTDDLILQNSRANNLRTTQYIGIQDSLYLFANRLIITPAIRTTHSNSIGIDGSTIERKYNNEQLGLRYQISADYLIKANYGHYYREPSLFELYGDRGFFLGNDQLKSESGINRDIGLQASYDFYQNPVNQFSLGINYFSNTIENLIIRTFDSRGVGKSFNAPLGFLDGIELDASLKLWQRLSISLNNTWQESISESNPLKILNGKRLPGRNAFSQNLRFDYQLSNHSYFIEHSYEQGMYYDQTNNHMAPEKDQYDLGARWNWQKITLQAEAKNVSDNRHEDFNGYPKPGRSYYLSIKYQFI